MSEETHGGQIESAASVTSPLMYHSIVTELGDTEWRAVLGLSNHSSSFTERKLFL